MKWVQPRANVGDGCNRASDTTPALAGKAIAYPLHTRQSALVGEELDALFDAIRTGDVVAVRALIDDGADPSGVTEGEWGRSALMEAAEHDHPDVMAVLLAAGANPNFAKANGWTALYHAVDTEIDAETNGIQPADGRLVALLLEAGADPDAPYAGPGRQQSPREFARHFPVIAALFNAPSAD